MAKRNVRADLAGAKPAEPSGAAAAGTGAASPPPPPPSYLTSRFHVKPDGVWMDRPDDKPQLWICSRLEPIAETEDEDGFFGMLWTWRDRNGRERQEVFAREQFAGEAGEMCRTMAARGVTFNSTRDARQAFVEYINLASSTVRAMVVYRTGWHTVGGVLVYVLAEQVFGKPPMRVILQSASREPNLFQQGGTLAAWRTLIAQRCISNSRLALSVCMAFAAPLLFLTGEDGGGVNLFGDSRTGKTTCGIIGASVCGGDPVGGGAMGAVRTWRGTSNSTEAVAAVHSDIGMIMDELGQADGRDVGACQYMLSGGQGKTRLDRAASLRAALRFRVFYLSTGEMTLAAKMAEAGVKIKAGQGVRLVDVPADEGAGLGAFAELHGAPDAGTFAQELREAAGKYYGTAFRAFITFLVGRLEREPGFRTVLREEMDRIATAWLRALGEHSGQVRTVARRFALIALAGNLATDAGITGWAKTEAGEREAEWAAHKCFMAWLGERGAGAGSHEDHQAVVQLRAFISRHAMSRFECWRHADASAPGAQTDPDSIPPPERYPVQNRVGWRRWTKEKGGNWAWRFFLTTDGMDEALAGLNYKAAVARTGPLVTQGLILPGPAEVARSMRPPGASKQRLYEVPASVMSAGMGPVGTDED